MNDVERPEAPMLVVGWDGADRSLVSDMVRDGRLPVLSALLARGSWTDVEGLPGLGDDAHWWSFSTGLRPGRHRRFHYFEPAGYDSIYLGREKSSRDTPFWATIADAGRQVVALDVPKSPMACRQGAVEVADWMAHGGTGLETCAWPTELAAGFDDHRPGGSFAVCHSVVDSEPGLTELEDLIDLRRGTRTEAAHQLIAEHRPDVAIVVYAASHCVGHHFWHEHEQSMNEGSGESRLERQLRSMDADLGSLIESVGAEARTVVFSLTGMAAAVEADDAVQATVAELGDVWLRRHPLALLRATALRAYWRAKGAARRPPSSTPFICPDASASATAIRLNIRGREPRGLIRQRGAARAAKWLHGKLLEMVDENGQQILAEVVVTANEYPGPFQQSQADFLAVWAVHRPERVTTSTTEVHGFDYPARRPGEHLIGGWMVTDGGLDPPDSPARVEELAEHVVRWTN